MIAVVAAAQVLVEKNSLVLLKRIVHVVFIAMFSDARLRY